MGRLLRRARWAALPPRPRAREGFNPGAPAFGSAVAEVAAEAGGRGEAVEAALAVEAAEPLQNQRAIGIWTKCEFSLQHFLLTILLPSLKNFANLVNFFLLNCF